MTNTIHGIDTSPLRVEFDLERFKKGHDAFDINGKLRVFIDLNNDLVFPVLNKWRSDADGFWHGAFSSLAITKKWTMEPEKTDLKRDPGPNGATGPGSDNVTVTGSIKEEYNGEFQKVKPDEFDIDDFYDGDIAINEDGLELRFGCLYEIDPGSIGCEHRNEKGIWVSICIELKATENWTMKPKRGEHTKMEEPAKKDDKFDLQKFKDGDAAIDASGDQRKFVAFDKDISPPLINKYKNERGRWRLISNTMEDAEKWTMKREPVVRYLAKFHNTRTNEKWWFHTNYETLDQIEELHHDGHMKTIETKRIVLEE